MLQDGTTIGQGRSKPDDGTRVHDAPAVTCESRSPVIEAGSSCIPGGKGRFAPASIDAGRTHSRDNARPSNRKRPSYGRRRTAYLIPFAVLVVLALLFVVWETALRRFLPTMSIGWHHALLTLWAGVVTAVACTGVWLIMHRQQRTLVATAARLSRLLESYDTKRSHSLYFTNPHQVRCWEVLNCGRTTCPMHGVSGKRCWQVVALNSRSVERGGPDVNIQKCHECKVFALSCPDSLTELGEGFNSLMYLLEREGRRVDRMRTQMVEKEKMVAIGQMATGIAHEVGNPLSSISSIVQIVKRSEPKDRVVEQLDLIETHIRRISGTVRQLVSFARPGSQRWELTDLAQTLRDALQLIGFDRRARNVEIVFDPPESVPVTFALRGELQQVLINLGLNALDAMPEGGRLTVELTARPQELVVRMTDTGIGIDETTGRRIFEPFFTTKEAGQGTGLGLSVSYGIVQKHGGRIEFTSIPGKGTTFTVQIPIWDNPPEVQR